MIEYNEKTMKEKCICENCDSKKILKHFERCEKCSSVAYHSTPRKLNPELWEEEETSKHERKRW